MNFIFEQLKRIKMCTPFVGYPQHNNNKYRPFFIIGSGRSGNTLLRRILNEHSELFIPPETYVMGESINLYRLYRKIEWQALVKLIYSTYAFHPEYDTFNTENLSSLYLQVSNCKKKERSLAYIFDSFYQHYRNIHQLKGKRWGDKTPLNTFYVNDINKVFPGSQYIHIIRNPYDSIYSYVKSGIYKNYKEAAERWLKSVEIAYDFGEDHPDSYYEIEYEQLVKEPVLHINNICQFLGVTYEETMLKMSDISNNLGDVQKLHHHANVLKPISSKYIGAGMSHLTNVDIKLVNRILFKSKNMKILNRIAK